VRTPAKVGGSAWESNPASPQLRGATDFEDRESHRAPFASAKCNCSGRKKNRPAEDPRAGTDAGSAFDQPNVTGARTLARFFRCELHALTLAQ